MGWGAGGGGGGAGLGYLVGPHSCAAVEAGAGRWGGVGRVGADHHCIAGHHEWPIVNQLCSVRIPSLFPKEPKWRPGQPKRQGGDDAKMGDAFGFRNPEAEPSERCEPRPEKASVRRGDRRRWPLSQRREDVQTGTIMKMGMMVMLTMAAFMS